VTAGPAIPNDNDRRSGAFRPRTAIRITAGERHERASSTLYIRAVPGCWLGILRIGACFPLDCTPGGLQIAALRQPSRTSALLLKAGLKRIAPHVSQVPTRDSSAQQTAASLDHCLFVGPSPSAVLRTIRSLELRPARRRDQRREILHSGMVERMYRFVGLLVVAVCQRKGSAVKD